MATYKRHAILSRCLRLVATQSRPPAEIIVVDASPDWEIGKARIEEEFARDFPGIPLRYLQAERASITAQRNQGIALALSDILFLVDDDSLLYPDCAAEIMRVYEADTEASIQGVAALHTPVPPDATGDSSTILSAQQVWRPRGSRLRGWLKSLLATDKTYFLPYDQDTPAAPLPATVQQLRVGRIQVMPGYAMTFRRALFEREQFCEALMRYAAGEDQDLSYRASRHGPIVLALDARLCHLEIQGGRLSTFQVTVLAALNPAVMQRLYGRDTNRLQRAWIAILRRRFVFGALKDLEARRWSLPTPRGIWHAHSYLAKIYAMPPDELSTWYPEVQQQLLESAR